MDINLAKKIQNRLKEKLELIPLTKEVATIAGVDAA
jgi:deoxyinosine 3'endonuclease (endonuclease V)